VKRDHFDNSPFLNAWVVYAEPTNGENFADVAPFIQETITFLDDVARRSGASTIRMSGRRGWERYLGELFTPIRVCYERRL
jgi:hypothetical protein